MINLNLGMNGKRKIVFVTILIVILTAVLEAVSIALGNITNVPIEFQPIVTALVAFFAMAPVTTLLAFARNMVGFFRSYLDKNPDETVTYNYKQFGTTLAYYAGIANTISVAIPAPWNQVPIAVLFVIDVVVSEIKRL